MQSVSLHSCGAAGEAVRSRPHRSCEADLCFVARRLGWLDRPRRTIIVKLRHLAEHNHFPLPKTPRFIKGARVTGPRSIDAFSIWDRDSVERWLEGDLPPAESAALAFARKASVRHEMGQRALSLVVSNG